MDRTTGSNGRRKRVAGMTGLIAAAAVGGGVIASALTANAATSGSSAIAAVTQAATHIGRIGGATPVRPGEKALSTATAQQLRAAALKAVPGGTVYRVETDADGAAYEAHMQKADGSLVTVKFNSNLTVSAVQSGMGGGAPGSGPPGSGA